VVVEFVVAEPVEASKRPQEKANKDGGFDKLSHRSLPILKIGFCVFDGSKRNFLLHYFIIYSLYQV